MNTRRMTLALGAAAGGTLDDWNDVFDVNLRGVVHV
jgi:NAD(P)-dependent dehydrogenase (short-subunit alcohol dehydrogenase family)